MHVQSLDFSNLWFLTFTVEKNPGYINIWKFIINMSNYFRYLLSLKQLRRDTRESCQKMMPMPMNSYQFICWLFKNSELCIQQLARSLCLTFLNIILIYFSKHISLKWFVFYRLHYLILHSFWKVMQYI